MLVVLVMLVVSATESLLLLSLSLLVVVLPLVFRQMADDDIVVSLLSLQLRLQTSAIATSIVRALLVAIVVIV